MFQSITQTSWQFYFNINGITSESSLIIDKKPQDMHIQTVYVNLFCISKQYLSTQPST